MLSHIVGDVYVAASAIGYVGPFNGSWRSLMYSKWIEIANELEIETSPDTSLQVVCSDPMLVREWNL